MNINPLLKNDDDIIADIRAKYQYYLTWANKYKAMLDAYESNNRVELPVEKTATLHKSPAPNESQQTIKSVKDPTPQSSGESLKELAARILKRENNPLTLNELYNKYRSEGGTIAERKTFGIRMSQHRNKGYFNNMEIKELPVDKRYWWGLPEWFDGDSLKEEYYSYLKKKFRLSESFFN